MEITGLLTGGERVRGDGFLVLKLVFSATEFSFQGRRIDVIMLNFCNPLTVKDEFLPSYLLYLLIGFYTYPLPVLVSN